MGINIGDNNEIKNTNIIESSDTENQMQEPKSFHERHPVIFALLITLVGGIILMLPFWDSILNWIEGCL